MGLSSKQAKKVWAKRRQKAGKATKEDLELLGNKGSTFEKIEPTPQPEQHQATPPEQNSEYKNIENSANYKDSTVGGFIEDAVHYGNGGVNANDFFERENNEAPNNEYAEFKTDQKTVNILRGSTILFFIDLIVPNIIVIIYKKIKKKSIDIKDLKLDENEKAELEPIADKVAEMIGINGMNPITELCVSLLFMYMAKIYIIEKF